MARANRPLAFVVARKAAVESSGTADEMLEQQDVDSAPAPVPLWRRTKRRLRPPVERLLAPGGCVVGARTDEPLVAITFDDGPDRSWTAPILEVLSARGTRATFFFLCANAEAAPALARRVIAEGHEVGLHGVDHTNLTTLSARAVLRRTRDGRRRLEEIVGAPVRWFRPPYGEQRIRSYAMVRAAGLDVVMWSTVGDDWLEQPAERAAQLIVPAVRPGAVVLLHDGWEPPKRKVSPPTFDRARMVEVLLDGLDDRGYRATSIGDLVSGREVVRSAASIV
jgi:peptidoglycan/xylan/chitin deacetylase (PgdA/CDA1 family)